MDVETATGAAAFQADDEGSIPFTRSSFNINDLAEESQRPKEAKMASGVTSGVTKTMTTGQPMLAKLTHTPASATSKPSGSGYRVLQFQR
jgi:hypothetical protein